jgi:hypothetical protein
LAPPSATGLPPSIASIGPRMLKSIGRVLRRT